MGKKRKKSIQPSAAWEEPAAQQSNSTGGGNHGRASIDRRSGNDQKRPEQYSATNPNQGKDFLTPSAKAEWDDYQKNEMGMASTTLATDITISKKPEEKKKKKLSTDKAGTSSGTGNGGGLPPGGGPPPPGAP